MMMNKINNLQKIMKKKRFFDANHANLLLSSLIQIACICTAPMQTQCKAMQTNAINRVIQSEAWNPTFKLFLRL